MDDAEPNDKYTTGELIMWGLGHALKLASVVALSAVVLFVVLLESALRHSGWL